MQFSVTLFGRHSYHLLVNLNSDLVRAALAAIIVRRHYHVFVQEPPGSTLGFRADLEPAGVAGLA
jgi:hypothetical protein